MPLVQIFRQTKTLVLIYELIAGNIYNITFKFSVRIYRISILKFYSYNVNVKISELSEIEDQKFSNIKNTLFANCIPHKSTNCKSSAYLEFLNVIRIY